MNPTTAPLQTKKLILKPNPQHSKPKQSNSNHYFHAQNTNIIRTTTEETITEMDNKPKSTASLPPISAQWTQSYTDYDAILTKSDQKYPLHKGSLTPEIIANFTKPHLAQFRKKFTEEDQQLINLNKHTIKRNNQTTDGNDDICLHSFTNTEETRNQAQEALSRSHEYEQEQHKRTTSNGKYQKYIFYPLYKPQTITHLGDLGCWQTKKATNQKILLWQCTTRFTRSTKTQNYIAVDVSHTSFRFNKILNPMNKPEDIQEMNKRPGAWIEANKIIKYTQKLEEGQRKYLFKQSRIDNLIDISKNLTQELQNPKNATTKYQRRNRTNKIISSETKIGTISKEESSEEQHKIYISEEDADNDFPYDWKNKHLTTTTTPTTITTTTIKKSATTQKTHNQYNNKNHINNNNRTPNHP